MYSHSNTSSFSPAINLYKSEGTQTAPTPTQRQDYLGYLSGFGYDGSAYAQGAQINFQSSTPWSTTDHSTVILFQAAAASSTSPTIVFRMNSNADAGDATANVSYLSLNITNGAVLGWANGESPPTVAFSRISPDVVALGNGTNGDTTGTLLLTQIGVGTSTPYARLSVWGPDSASSTLAFNVVNNASTTVFAVFDGGNAQLSGTLTQSSDQRLKTNVQSLDASSTLALIAQLNPVTFNWINPDQGNGTQVGFIAQQVQQIFPQLVSTTSPTALTPNGTLGLNYIGLISPIISAIQALYADIQSIDQTLTSFAQKFTTNELCVNKSDDTPVCVTGDQLAALLAGNGGGTGSGSSSSGGGGGEGDQSPSAAQLGPSSASSTPESVTQNFTNSGTSTLDSILQDDTDNAQATTSPATTGSPSIVPSDYASTTASTTISQ